MASSADSGDQTFETDADGSFYYSFEAEGNEEMTDLAESRLEAKTEVDIKDVNTSEDKKVPNKSEDAEACEADILYMPALADILNDITETERQKTLVVEPVMPEDLSIIKTLIESAVCKNASLAFVRDQDEAVHGMLTLSYASSADAEAAKLKFTATFPDYCVENPPASKSANVVMENWKQEHTYNRQYQLLASTMLIVKNLNPATVTVERLHELFPDAANIVIGSEPTSYIGKLKGTVHAYILYGSEQAATAAFMSLLSTPVCLDDQQLIVQRYKDLPEDLAPDYLKLSTRQLVLFQLNRANEFITKAEKDPTFELRDRWPKRFKRATELIKKDDVARDSLGLPKPSFEELAGLKRLTSNKRAEVLSALGLADCAPGADVKPEDRYKIPKLFKLNQPSTSCNGNADSHGIPSLTDLRFPGFSRPRGMLPPDLAYMHAFRGRGWRMPPEHGMPPRMPMHRFPGPWCGMPPSMAQQYYAMLLEQSLIDEDAFW